MKKLQEAKYKHKLFKKIYVLAKIVMKIVVMNKGIVVIRLHLANNQIKIKKKIMNKLKNLIKQILSLASPESTTAKKLLS